MKDISPIIKSSQDKINMLSHCITKANESYSIYGTWFNVSATRTLDLTSQTDFYSLPTGKRVVGVSLIINGAGGGGGAGAYHSSGGGNGGGAGSSGPTLIVSNMYVGDVDTLPITIGSGGSGGVVSLVAYPNGSTGGSTIIEIPGRVTFTVPGGDGGVGLISGASSSSSWFHSESGDTNGDDVRNLFNSYRGSGIKLKPILYARGGSGGHGIDNLSPRCHTGLPGLDFMTYTGGSGGTGTAVSSPDAAGGGGGSSANFWGGGANGGNGSTTVGANGSNAANYGTGGGGGGGGYTGAGNGGNGAGGFVKLHYWWE